MPPAVPPHPPPLQSHDLRPGSGFLWRNRHVTVPLAVPAVFLGAGLAVRLFPHWRGELAVAAAVAVIGMHAHAPHRWDRPAEQWYARLSAVAAGGWLCAAAWLGVTSVMLAVLGALGTAWGIPWYIHKRPRDRSRTVAVIAEWDAWWQHHAQAWDVWGSGVTAVASSGPAEILTVKLWAGRQTVATIERIVPLIESALAGYVPHGGVRVAKVHGNPSLVLVHLRRRNPLAAQPIRWTPDLVPQSITEPAAIGMDEQGRWKRVKLLVNWLIIGRTRSGKSNQLSLMLAAITSCPDAAPPWLIAMKGGRAARPWMEALGWPATTIPEARILLRTAVAEIEARGMHAYDGAEQVEPSEECPAIFVVIDEANGVTSEGNGDAECARHVATIASQGSGVAVHVVVSTQHGALAESVRTEQTRANLLARICFAVSEARHGTFAVGEDYSRYDASKLEEAGSFLARIGRDAPCEPHRAPELPHDLVRQIASANAALSRPPLRLYASHLQDEFDARWLRLPEPFRKLAPQYAAAVTAGYHSPAPEAAMDETHEPDADVLDFSDRLARIEADVASIPDLASLAGLDLPSESDLSSEMRRRWLRFARDLMTAGPEGVSPEQLVAHTGLSRSSVHVQLRDLTSTGAVTKPTKGRYRGTPGVNTWDAMDTLRQDRDLLLASARSA